MTKQCMKNNFFYKMFFVFGSLTRHGHQRSGLAKNWILKLVCRTYAPKINGLTNAQNMFVSQFFAKPCVHVAQLT